MGNPSRIERRVDLAITTGAKKWTRVVSAVVFLNLLLVFPSSSAERFTSWLSHPRQQTRLPDDSHLIVSTTSGTFIGFTHPASSTANNPVDTWRGIPYAHAPTGSLRFRAPVLHKANDQHGVPKDTVQPAYEFGHACPQPKSPDVPVPISEDCLSLNIYRPSNPNSPLPVLVWIHGGGLTYGCSAAFDGTIIVSSSVEFQQPIVFVSINYRLNSFGFLNTDELPLEDLQVGLKDQVASLEWLKLNVLKFGGDPTRITLWGQSAGAFSIGMLMTYLPEPISPSSALFRAVIMDSGSPTSHTVPPVGYYDQDGAPYHILISLTGCNNRTYRSKASSVRSLECLRALPYETLFDATSTVTRTGPYPLQLTIWGPSFKAGSFIDQRPSKRLAAGKFLKIPMMVGTNKDEGAIAAAAAGFAYGRSGMEPKEFFFSYMSNSSLLDLSTLDQKVYETVDELYPNDPSQGSPFDTGNQTFGLPPIFKKLAAWFGDLHYQAPRRLWAQKASGHQPTYVYYFTGPRNSSDPLYAGVPHSSELRLVFGSGWNNHLNQSEIEETERLAIEMRKQYINFVHELKPKDNWPVYTKEGKKVMVFDRTKIEGEVILDGWREEEIDYLNSQAAIDTYLT